MHDSSYVLVSIFNLSAIACEQCTSRVAHSYGTPLVTKIGSMNPTLKCFNPILKLHIKPFQLDIKTSQSYVETFQPDVKAHSNLR